MGRVRTLKDPTLRNRARELRRGDTQAEARLWEALRDRRLGGWRWKRQVPKGPFILDFYCDEGRLAVEADGGQHSERVDYDARRTAYLEHAGIRVLRFWNSAILTNRAGVCDTILGALGGEHARVRSGAPPLMD